MTSINWLKQPDRLVVFNDMASYGADGILRNVVGKTVAIPHLPAAVACRGYAWWTALLAEEFACAASSFDDLVLRVVDLFSRAVTKWNSLVFHDNVGPQLFLGGWSKARGPEIYFIAGSDLHLHPNLGEDLTSVVTSQPFELVALSGGGNLPALRGDDWADGFAIRPTSVDDIDDVNQYARTCLELQRRHKYPADDRVVTEHHVVGGGIQVTSITADGIESRIVHRWADRIGELITPDAIDWSSWRDQHSKAASGTVSRLKREMLEKKQRKRAMRAA